MEHKSSKVKVYQTEDYKLFTLLDGNRPLNKKKISRIIEEIKGGNDILDLVPVLVRETRTKLEVLDGQHRLEIARQLKRPVHYILQAQDMTLHNVAKVNSNTEKWKDSDFINCYIKAGVRHYKTLADFQKTYGFAVGICLVLLKYGSLKGDGTSGHEKLRLDFEQGVFEVKKLKEATMTAEICKTFEKFPSWSGRPFVVAICKLLDAGKCDFGILAKKFNEDPAQLTTQGNWKSYMTLLEQIYNRNNSKRRTIF